MDEVAKSADCRECQAEQSAEIEALKRLNDASSRLWRTNSLRAGLEEMLAATIQLLGADMGNVQIIDHASRKLKIAAQRGFGSEFLEFFREVAADDNSACGRALRWGERVIVEDVERDPLFACCLHIVRNAGFRAVQSTPLVDHNGNTLGMISTHFRSSHRPSELDLQRLDLYARQASDFVERCRREEELRQRAEEREALLDALPAFVWFGDAQNRVIRGNRAANKMTDVPDGANVSQSVAASAGSTYLRQLKRDGTEYLAEELPIQTAIATRRLVQDAYIDFRFPDGRRVETIGNAAPLFDASGAVRGGVAAFIDVGERNRAERALRESEEFNRTIIESSPDCVKVLDLEGRLLMINASGRRLLDIDDVTPLLGQDWRVLWPRTAMFEDRDILAEVKAGNTCRFQEFHPTFKGTPKWWDVMVAPVRGSDGQIVRILSLSRDATERRQAEEALREADRRKDEFLATLAHELRNPLAPIRNGLLVLRKSDGQGPVAERMQAIMERQVDHLLRLVDDLLEVSRISRGKIELKKERVTLSAVIDLAVQMSRDSIDAAGIELRVALSDQAFVLDADPVRLTQIFGNLLNNAAKYTDQGGDVQISAMRDGNDVVASVADSGVGIPKEVLPRVFDLFAQFNRTRGRAQGGLGIGLALVKNLTELHGGKVEAQSNGEGCGSRFIVRLPLSKAAKPDEPTRESTPSTAASSLRVLVVDDAVDVADAFAALLESMHAEVRVVNGGAEGLRACVEFEPELIFLDIGMPHMDGFETARRLRKLPAGREVTLVALTGWGEEETRRRARDAGFDRHLTKPADLGELEALLVEVACRNASNEIIDEA